MAAEPMAEGAPSAVPAPGSNDQKQLRADKLFVYLHRTFIWYSVCMLDRTEHQVK